MSSQTESEPSCFLCGRTGLRDRRFCSMRCRDAYDRGFPRHEPNHARAILAAPLGDWKIVAGPSGCAIGESYYGPLLERMSGRRKRRKVSSGPRSINSKFVKNNHVQPMACEAIPR